MQFFRRGKLEFLSDSAEQIARSMDMTGLRAKINQAFQTVIARARGHPQSSSEPAINDDSEIDSRNGRSLKWDERRILWSRAWRRWQEVSEAHYGSSRNYN